MRIGRQHLGPISPDFPDFGPPKPLYPAIEPAPPPPIRVHVRTKQQMHDLRTGLEAAMSWHVVGRGRHMLLRRVECF